MGNILKTGIYFLVGILSACQDISFEGKANDVPTAGTIAIGFEPGDSFMVTQWIEIFHSQYPKATIIPVFKEKEPLKALLLADSLHGIFLHDTFSQAEKNWLTEKKNATVNEVIMGYTAPAFVVSKKSTLKSIDFQSPDPFKKHGIQKIILRHSLCSEEQHIQRYLKQLLKDSLRVSMNAFNLLKRERLSSDKEIIEYISRNPQSIGLVSLNAIADRKDSLSVALQKLITILPVKNESGQFHLPFQSQIKAKQYPLIQPLVSYEMQGYSGLIKGFVIYANSQSGQALMQKSGLLPANHQGRKIQIDISNP
jgi:phosphate transport system substrate-binding protein